MDGGIAGGGGGGTRASCVMAYSRVPKIIGYDFPSIYLHPQRNIPFLSPTLKQNKNKLDIKQDKIKYPKVYFPHRIFLELIFLYDDIVFLSHDAARLVFLIYIFF